MRHRGAEGADNKTGDGAGIMLQIPHEFILLQGIPVPEKENTAPACFSFPKTEKTQAAILSVIIEEIEKDGLTLMHLRNVPLAPKYWEKRLLPTNRTSSKSSSPDLRKAKPLTADSI